MKKSKGSKLNSIFSAFLIIGYIICTYFFSMMASQVSGTAGVLIQVLVLVVFGLLLFYATRVGEGRQVRRFSLSVLLLVDLPAVLIILFGIVEGMPFHDMLAPQASLLGQLGAPSIIMTLACIALGYGIPYTFLSGYEMKSDDEPDAPEEKPVEGGLAEELADTEAQTDALETETALAETPAEEADTIEENEEKEAE